MKNILVAIGLLASLTFSSGPGGYGLPPYLWQATYALNVTQGEPDLPRNIADAQRFVDKIQAATSAKYSSISLNRAVDLRDANATASAFQSGNTNSSELFFFAGHGNYNLVRFYETTMNLSNLVLTGWTRYGFLVSCLTLNQKDPYNYVYTGAFSGGVHALLGYESDHRWYIVSYGCNWLGYNCSHYRSEDKWDKFATKWITNDGYLQDSWLNAVKETSWDQAGQGVAPAIVYSWGWINGEFYVSSYENLPYMYNEMVPTSLSRSHYYTTYGTPYYGGVQ